jgi:hypothetical protein
MSPPFPAEEPQTRRQPDYADLASAKLIVTAAKCTISRWTRHNPEPGMLTEIMQARGRHAFRNHEPELGDQAVERLADRARMDGASAGEGKQGSGGEQIR